VREKVRRAPPETEVNCGIKNPQGNINCFVEFGTSKMGAQPYLRPAVEQNRETVRELLGEGFNDAVERSD
jgi:HK97 gp10 family phage protein